VEKAWKTISRVCVASLNFRLQRKLFGCIVFLCTLFLNEEERALPNRKISSLAKILKQARSLCDPLKKLIFEVFWILFALIEMWRLLKTL
jgi:hypothetical protein